MATKTEKYLQKKRKKKNIHSPYNKMASKYKCDKI